MLAERQCRPEVPFERIFVWHAMERQPSHVRFSQLAADLGGRGKGEDFASAAEVRKCDAGRPEASTLMARARRAVTRRKGRTGRLNRRKATSIASVMPSTGNAVMASLADVMSTGRPDRNSDSARKFFSHSGFTAARFYEPPTFDRCENTGRLNLYGARITFSGTLFGFIPGWTTDSDVGIRLRLLRKLADETKNHDLERDLYIEERRAERGIRLARYFRVGRPGWPRLVAHCLWIAIMGIYWLLTDYGRSVIRPLIALVASIFVFNASYSVVLSPPPAMSETTFRNAVWAFTIANAVPFVGALSLEKELKDTILCAASSSPACDGLELHECAIVPRAKNSLSASCARPIDRQRIAHLLCCARTAQFLQATLIEGREHDLGFLAQHG
jgi:hypothetical protein